MIWKKPSEQLTGTPVFHRSGSSESTPFQSCSRMPELTWKQAEVDVRVFQVAVVGELRHDAVGVPERERTLSEAPLMSWEIRTSEPASPMATRRGR